MEGLIALMFTIASWLFGILLALGVIFLVIAGFKLILAQGDETKIGDARKMILWSLIGIVVGGLAVFFKDTIMSLIAPFMKGWK